MELYETCKEWSQSPFDYWFPGLDDPEAKYLIDKHVMKRGRKIHKELEEQRKKPKHNTKDQDKNTKLLQQAIEAEHGKNQ